MAVRPRRRRSSVSAETNMDDPALLQEQAAALEVTSDAEVLPPEDGEKAPEDEIISVEIQITRLNVRANNDGSFWVGGGGILIDGKSGKPQKERNGSEAFYNFTYTAEKKDGLPQKNEVWSFEGTEGKKFNNIPSLMAVNGRPVASENNLEGVVRWLCSNCEGIGTVRSQNIIKKFGADTEKNLGDIDKLMSVAGLNREIAEEIAERWNAGRGSAKIDVFLRNFKNEKGVVLFNVNQRRAIAKEYPDINELKKAFKNNPYDFVSIKDISFRVMDGYAIKAGDIDLKGPVRIRAALDAGFRENVEKNGSTIGSQEEVIDAVKQLLDSSAKAYGSLVVVPKDVIASELELIKKGEPFKPNPEAVQTLVWNPISKGFQRSSVFKDEWTIASKTLEILKRGPRMSKDEAKELTGKALQRMRANFKLDPSQEEAVVTALMWPVCIITGGPGTGKSTVMKVFQAALKQSDIAGEDRLNIVGASFTGKASLRLEEASGIPSSTIHKMLGAKGLDEFTFNESNLLRLIMESEEGMDEERIIHQIALDEDTMTDNALKARIFEALHPETAIVMSGDIDQLPSVGVGQTFRDMIESGLIPVVELQKGHRQNQFSGIPEVARRLQNGEHPFTVDDFKVPEGQIETMFHNPKNLGTKFPIPNLPGIFWIDPDKMPDHRGRLKSELPREEQGQHIMSVVRDVVSFMAMNKIPQEDVLVITPQRKNNGSDDLNKIIRPQRVLDINKDDSLIPQTPIKNFEGGLRVGDMVMQGHNCNGLANGQPGTVVDFVNIVDDDKKEHRYPVIDFGGKRVVYGDELIQKGNLTPNNANTVHKYQGSESPVVVIVIPDGALRMATLENIYTALTRAKVQAYFIASEKAIKSILIKDNERRNTGLGNYLKVLKSSLVKDLMAEVEKNPAAKGKAAPYLEYMERNEKILLVRREREERRKANVELRKQELNRGSRFTLEGMQSLGKGASPRRVSRGRRYSVGQNREQNGPAM